MSEEARKDVLSAREWMDYYEKLFREKNPVKGSPMSIEKERDESSSEEIRRDN